MVHVLVRERLTKREPMPDWETVDLSKLEPALAAPQQGGFGRKEFYPEIEDKAAILLYTMVKNHAWSNGNKRMAMISTLLFLGLNDHWWEVQNEEIRAHVAWVAASEARCFDEALAYLKSYFRLKVIKVTDWGEITQQGRADEAI